MGDYKCSKCSAEIPTDSKFCLNCGAKVTKETKPGTEQVHQVFQFLFSKDLIIAAILFGFLLIWIGVIVLTFSSSYTGIRVAEVLNSLGFFVAGAFLVGGGIANDNMDRFIRIGMIIIGVYMITSVLALASLIPAIPWA